MDNVFKLIIFLFLIFSGFVFADTYPRVTTYSGSMYGTVMYSSSTLGGACSAACPLIEQMYAVSPCVSAIVYPNVNLTNSCIAYGSSGNVVKYFGVNVDYSCPGGGTVSGDNCINAPACISPSVRKTVSPYACFTPVECAYPETDDGTGVCQNHTCPVGETRNPSTKLCQIAPNCAAVEAYDIYTNTCKLVDLPCPNHSHANAANDACLPDAPLNCPVGKHDDGTYLCVADDAVGCTSGQVHGYIDGIPQCIKKTNESAFANEAAIAQARADTAAAAEVDAKAAMDSAEAASAADPADAAKFATAQAASAAHDVAVASAADFKARSDLAKSDADSAALRSIAENSKLANEREISKKASAATACTGQPSCSGDAIQCAILLQIHNDKCIGLDGVFASDLPTAETIGSMVVDVSANSVVPVVGQCPAPQNVVTTFGSFPMSFQPLCDFAESNSAMVVALAWLISGYIVFGSKVG